MNQDGTYPRRWLSLPLQVALALSWGASLAARPWAPARIPTHWNVQGEADGFMGRFPGLFIAPLVITLLVGLFQVWPRIDPLGRNYTAFTNVYRQVQIGIVLFLTIVHLLAIAVALGWVADLSLAVMLLTGILLIGLGNVMGKLRPNSFLGIRTPWTLSSPDVWTRTHHFAGRLMVGFGLVLIVTALFLPRPYVPQIVAVGAAGLALITFGYSYWTWRQLISTNRDQNEDNVRTA